MSYVGKTGLAGYTLLQELDRIRLHQGINSSTTTAKGSLLGMINAEVDGSATLTLFGSSPVGITAPKDGTVTWTVPEIIDYDIVITLNGTGLLIPSINYKISGGGDIGRLGGAKYESGEIYTIMLFKK